MRRERVDLVVNPRIKPSLTAPPADVLLDVLAAVHHAATSGALT